MSGSQPKPFRFAPEPGTTLVGDLLPGGGPPYLFLPGLGSSRQGVKSDSLFAHAAAQGRAALRIDQRGHGESTGTLGTVTFGELVEDAVALLDHLGPVVLAGSSLGGLVAAFASVRRPARVRGLGLIAPAFGFLGRLDRLLDADHRLRTSSGMLVPIAPRVLADARQHDERSLAGELRVPTLVAHGTADEVVPYQASVAFHRALRTAHTELWLVPGACHRLHAATPELWPRLDALVAAAGTR